MKTASLRDILIVVAVCVVAIFGTAYLLNPPEKEPDEYFTYSISAYDYLKYVDDGVTIPSYVKMTSYTIHLDHTPSHKVAPEIYYGVPDMYLVAEMTEKDKMFYSEMGDGVEGWSEGRTWCPDWYVVSKGFSKI